MAHSQLIDEERGRLSTAPVDASRRCRSRSGDSRPGSLLCSRIGESEGILRTAFERARNPRRASLLRTERSDLTVSVVFVIAMPASRRMLDEVRHSVQTARRWCATRVYVPIRARPPTASWLLHQARRPDASPRQPVGRSSRSLFPRVGFSAPADLPPTKND